MPKAPNSSRSTKSTKSTKAVEKPSSTHSTRSTRSNTAGKAHTSTGHAHTSTTHGHKGILEKVAEKIEDSAEAINPGHEGGHHTGTGAHPTSNIPTHSEFMKHAHPLDMAIFHHGRYAKNLTEKKRNDDVVDHVELLPKEMSTGSIGWSGSKNAKMPLAGHPEGVNVMISVNVTIKGSKPHTTTSGVAGGSKGRTKRTTATGACSRRSGSSSSSYESD